MTGPKQPTSPTTLAFVALCVSFVALALSIAAIMLAAAVHP